jgi:hypothetical protein
MLEMIDTTNTDATNTAEFLATDFTPAATDPQTELGAAITDLWIAHSTAKNTVRMTKGELRAIRAKLGEQLCRMKEVLASPGRDGQWSRFLRKVNIPRATGDRLVGRHLRSMNPETNCISEEISEPTEEEVQRLFTVVWPKLRRTLRSEKSLHLFIDLLASHYQHGEQMGSEIPVATHPTATPDLPSGDGDRIVESKLGSGFCSTTAPMS